VPDVLRLVAACNMVVPPLPRTSYKVSRWTATLPSHPNLSLVSFHLSRLRRRHQGPSAVHPVDSLRIFKHCIARCPTAIHQKKKKRWWMIMSRPVPKNFFGSNENGNHAANKGNVTTLKYFQKRHPRRLPPTRLRSVLGYFPFPFPTSIAVMGHSRGQKWKQLSRNPWRLPRTIPRSFT